MPQKFISQLAHVEITTPKPEESLRFFTDVMGLFVTERRGQSVYLRGWGEFFHHSLQLTEGRAPGLGKIGWRAFGQDGLEAAVKRLEAAGAGSGQGLGWAEDNVGLGRSYRYRGPGGHVHELFWEVERYQPPAELAPIFPNRPQRYVPKGLAARHLDHVTITTADVMKDVAWYRDTLGHRFMEYTVPEDRPDLVVFAMTTTIQRSHDLGIVVDFSGVPGRVNHIAYWVDQREELRRAADVLLDADIAIEFGPGRHGMGEQDYLYCREPGGLRIELNSGGYENHQPDWEPVRFMPSQGSNVYYRNQEMPHSMFESFPNPEQAAAPEDIKKTGLFV